MLSPLLLFIMFIVAVQSSYPYPPFNGLHHQSRIENMVEPEFANRRMFQRNEVVRCDMDDILNFVGLEEMQQLIEAMALRNGISPFMVLRKLNRRMRNKEELEESMINAIDGPELLNHPLIDLPPAIKIPPESSRAPYFLPPNVLMNDGNDEDTVVIIPVEASSINRSPIGVKTDHKPRKESTINANNMSPLVGKLSNMLPGVFLSQKTNHLKPPLGAVIRVNSGDPMNPLNRDIAVTVSPLMTLIEALRQAEIKYQDVLDLNHDTDIFTFAHSEVVDCYIISSIDDIVKSDIFGWKIAIVDRDGQVVYDSFCLPSGKEALVKPGTVISLAYVPI